MYILCGAKCRLYCVDGARRAEIGVACRSPLSPVLPPAGGADDSVHWICTCAPKGEGLITSEARKYYRSAFSYAGHTLGWNVCTSLVFLCAIPLRMRTICWSHLPIFRPDQTICRYRHRVTPCFRHLRCIERRIIRFTSSECSEAPFVCERSDARYDVRSFSRRLQTNFRSSVGSSPWNRRGAGLAFRSPQCMARLSVTIYLFFPSRNEWHSLYWLICNGFLALMVTEIMSLHPQVRGVVPPSNIPASIAQFPLESMCCLCNARTYWVTL